MPKLLLLIASSIFVLTALGLKVKTVQGNDHKARLQKAREDFTDFASKNGRNYQSNDEFKKARRNYIRNSARIERFNKEHEGTDGQKQGINKFSDMSGPEFEKYVQLDK